MGNFYNSRLFCVLNVFFLVLFTITFSFSAQTQVLTDAVTLELSFGFTAIDREYLLARPQSIAVNENGDIYISDEDKIKIYDKDGREKFILGRKGEGPGEFQRTPRISISPTGYVTAGLSEVYNVFTPDNNLVTKTNFRNSEIIENMLKESNLYSFASTKIMTMDEKNYLIGGNGYDLPLDTEGPTRNGFSMLIHLNDEMTTVYTKNLNDNVVQGMTERGTRSRVRHIYLGDFHWDITTKNKVVFTNTGYDSYIDKAESYYTLHIVELETHAKTELNITYNPVAIPDSVINMAILPWGSSLIYGSDRPYADNMRERLREAKYLPSINGLIADRNYLFSFIYHDEYPDKAVAQVIDINTGNHIATLLFPVKPDIIKNGYAYELKRATDTEFAEVRKYKIDPKVYGK